MLIAITKKLFIGFCLAVLGLIISMLTRNWNISVTWFGILGMIIMGVGGLVGDGGRNTSLTRQSYNDRQDAFGFALIMFLIGLPCLLIAVGTYLVTR